jgi:alkyl sulfatase BDS1-like metallo-beta-lactamase superfamily hydrolase
MDLVSIRQDVIEQIKKATQLEDNEKYEEARKTYIKACDNLKILIKSDGNKYSVDTYEQKLKEYEERSVYLKELIEKIENNKKVPIGGGEK